MRIKWRMETLIRDGGSQLSLQLYKHFIMTSRQKYRQIVENMSWSAEWWESNDPDEGLAYPSFRLSLTGAGLTDILGWVEMELCDWLLVKDDVSRLTGDIGGVGLLHSECEREPGGAEVKGMNSDSLRTAVTLVTRWCNCRNSTVPLSDPVERG